MKEAEIKKKADEDEAAEMEGAGAAPAHAGQGPRLETAYEKLQITQPVARGIFNALFLPPK